MKVNIPKKSPGLDSKRVAFLFGSGISVPAKMPNVKEITDSVENGTDYVKTPSGTYGSRTEFQRLETSGGANSICRAKECVKYMKGIISKYHSKPGVEYQPNYEDLYFYSVQMSEAITHELENPALMPSILHAQEKLKQLFDRGRERDKDFTSLQNVFEETMRHIEKVLQYKLETTNKTRLDHLSFLEEAKNDQDVERIDVCTLNHDLLLEKYFEKYFCKYSNENQSQYNDGFRKEPSGIYQWDPNQLFVNKKAPLLLKLHGSIDWYYYKSDGNLVLRKILSPLEMQDMGIGGLNVFPYLNQPQLLVGTYNK